MAELTANEQEFLKYLKRKLFFKNYDIRFKVSLHDLYQERNDLSFTFGQNEDLLKDIIIDFILSKDNKVVCGIEIVDEDDELDLSKGRLLLIDSLFKQMNYKYFRVVDLTKLKQAAGIIADKL